MGEKEWSPANVLDVFGDPIARATLVAASERPVAAKDLAEEFDVSPPTIYRRIDPLVDANLLRERQRIDRDGNQHSEYETAVEEVTFAIDDDGYTVDIQVRQDLADDFESLWSDLESTNPGSKTGRRSRSGRSDTTDGDLS